MQAAEQRMRACIRAHQMIVHSCIDRLMRRHGVPVHAISHGWDEATSEEYLTYDGAGYHIEMERAKATGDWTFQAEPGHFSPSSMLGTVWVDSPQDAIFLSEEERDGGIIQRVH